MLRRSSTFRVLDAQPSDDALGLKFANLSAPSVAIITLFGNFQSNTFDFYSKTHFWLRNSKVISWNWIEIEWKWSAINCENQLLRGRRRGELLASHQQQTNWLQARNQVSYFGTRMIYFFCSKREMGADFFRLLRSGNFCSADSEAGD